MKKKQTSDILFQIIHTEKIGVIGVVFTPIKVWEKTNHIAVLQKYSEFKEIFNKLELKALSNSVFEHSGSLIIQELETALINEGFKKDPKFSLYVDIEYSFEGLSNEEILTILRGT